MSTGFGRDLGFFGFAIRFNRNNININQTGVQKVFSWAPPGVVLAHLQPKLQVVPD